jgi:hypothetical protein
MAWRKGSEKAKMVQKWVLVQMGTPPIWEKDQEPASKGSFAFLLHLNDTPAYARIGSEEVVCFCFFGCGSSYR